MQESIFTFDELQVGQTASILVDDVLGSWEVTRLVQGELILASPEIPVDAETRVHLLQAALLENFSESLPTNGRFYIDEERRLRFQVCTLDADVDLAIRNVAQLYAQVVNPEVYLPIDEDAPLDIEKLLAEQSTEEVAAEESSAELVSLFFELLTQDPDLRDCLVIDLGGTQGLIQLLNGELPILVVPETQQKQIFLYYPITLLTHEDAEPEQLETALLANSMLRLGQGLSLGCIDELSSLYLRARVSFEHFNIEAIKDALGVLIATGRSVEEIMNRVDAATYQPNSSAGVLV